MFVQLLLARLLFGFACGGPAALLYTFRGGSSAHRQRLAPEATRVFVQLRRCQGRAAMLYCLCGSSSATPGAGWYSVSIWSPECLNGIPGMPADDQARADIGTKYLDIKRTGLTRAMRRKGWSVLPPIEIVVDGDVQAPADILDSDLQRKLHNWICSGVIALLHFGTPCTSFSRARRNDGGPPPIRSPEHLFGIPGISEEDLEKVRMGTVPGSHLDAR